MKPATPSRSRRVAGFVVLTVASAAYLVVLAGLTLGPQPDGANGILRTLAEALSQWPPTAWVTYLVLEFTANIALFVPVGVLWVLWATWSGSSAMTRRWWIAVPLGLALSALIEAIQATVLADRVPDVRDLISNTLGSLLGAVLSVVVVRWIQRRRKRAR